jgi:hypothetical protein
MLINIKIPKYPTDEIIEMQNIATLVNIPVITFISLLGIIVL